VKEVGGSVPGLGVRGHLSERGLMSLVETKVRGRIRPRVEADTSPYAR
jgi:hypothetical protein